MKAAQFNQLIATIFALPLATVIVYTRALKEAGLLTSTGARGRAAPDMTALDAARVVIAILSTEGPSQAVERVIRFGTLRYSPHYRTYVRAHETIEPDAFADLFSTSTLEAVLAEIIGLPAAIGIDEACKWHDTNRFSLRISDFDLLAELVRWKWDEDEIIGECVIPFKGQTMSKSPDELQSTDGFEVIKGHVRTRRETTGLTLLSLGIMMQEVT